MEREVKIDRERRETERKYICIYTHAHTPSKPIVF